MHRIERIINHVVVKNNINTTQQYQYAYIHSATTAAKVQVPMRISTEVSAALRDKRPVVALESTIISHGMPYPENVSTARRVEEICRENGATPATIAILNGVIHVGLESKEIEELGRLGTSCIKVSRRDLALVISQQQNGATTVAATMYIAHLAGIDIFVTGGIGGVHRGVEQTLDISADLTELGRTPVTVICAGVKSILDIPKTLEFLETQGVTVVTLGSKQFPAFFTADSGHASPAQLQSAQQCAQLIDANKKLSLESGIVIAVPVPAHQAAQASVVEKAINQALQESNDQKIMGRDVTPFLLKRVNQLTAGQSLKSNIALIENNVKIGATIASHLSQIRNKTKQ